MMGISNKYYFLTMMQQESICLIACPISEIVPARAGVKGAKLDVLKMFHPVNIMCVM